MRLTFCRTFCFAPIPRVELPLIIGVCGWILVSAYCAPADEPSFVYWRNAGTQAEILHSYGTAQAHFARALRAAKLEFGVDSPQYEESMARLAATLIQQGRLDSAKPLVQRVLQQASSTKGKGRNLEGLLWLDDLADAYDRQALTGRNMDVCLRNALAIRDKLSGGKHVKLADTLFKLASYYNLMRKAREAEPLCERALPLHVARCGEYSFPVAQDLLLLGTIYQTEGKNRQARTVYHRVIPVLSKRSGYFDPTLNVASVYIALAQIAVSEKNYAEAEATYKKALPMELHAVPPNDWPGIIYMNLGNVYLDECRYSKAEQLYKESIDYLVKRHGPKCPQELSPTLSLARLLRQTHRPREADKLLALADSIRAGQKTRPKPVYSGTND